MSKIKSLKIKQEDGSYTTVALGANSVNIDMANGDTLEAAMGKKQNTLTAGDNITITNNVISSSSVVEEEPIGTIKIWPNNTIPEGYLLCNGQAVSRTQYSDLFAVIGTTYGAGNSSTTFNVPDLQDNVPAGASSNHTLASKYGAVSVSHNHTQAANTGAHKLTVNEMPSHTHTFTGIKHFHTIALNPQGTGEGVGPISTFQHGSYNTGTSSDIAGGTNSNTGGNGTHSHTLSAVNNTSVSTIQPTIALNYIIKALNITTTTQLINGIVENSLTSGSTTNAPSVAAVTAAINASQEGTTLFYYEIGTVLDDEVSITLSETINNFKYVEIEGWTANHGTATLPFLFRFPCYNGIDNRYMLKIAEWWTPNVEKIKTEEISIKDSQVVHVYGRAYTHDFSTLQFGTTNFNMDDQTESNTGAIHITAIRGYDRR